MDTNTNAGGGLRIFPDALTPTAFGFRNTVIVNVKTTPPLAGQVVRLKSFDVDDPSSNTGGIIDTNDYFGFPTGNDNRGTPKAGQFSQTTLTLDSQGKAFAVLTVPTQPGDNLRVAAVLDTPGAQAHLDALQVAVEQDELFLTPDTNSVVGFVGGISPMLTIWRKLHLEFDSMEGPPSSGLEANYTSGTVTSFKPNFPVAGRSRVSVRHSNTTGGAGDNFFERGKFEIPGVNSYLVTNSVTRIAGAELVTQMEIIGAPALATGSVVRLYDDDDQYLANDSLYPSLLGLQSPPLPLNERGIEFVTNIQPSFAMAYILLVNFNQQWNTTIAFKRRSEASLIGGVFDAGNQQLKGADKPEFWAYTVVFGYEPAAPEDGEPNTEAPTAGDTVKKILGLPHGYSAVFIESIRERKFGIGRDGAVALPAAFNTASETNLLRRLYLDDLYGVIAHEIGHAPGGNLERTDHAEKGLMETGAVSGIRSTDFSDYTIRRFRKATSWTQ